MHARERIWVLALCTATFLAVTTRATAPPGAGNLPIAEGLITSLIVPDRLGPVGTACNDE